MAPEFDNVTILVLGPSENVRQRVRVVLRDNKASFVTF